MKLGGKGSCGTEDHRGISSEMDERGQRQAGEKHTHTGFGRRTVNQWD